MIDWRKLTDKYEDGNWISSPNECVCMWLRDNLENEHNSSLEDNGVRGMLEQCGRGNFKTSRRWGWLFRNYKFASIVNDIEGQANVLDIGCDDCALFSFISKSFYCTNPVYVGVDLERVGLELAFRNLQRARSDIWLVQSDIVNGLDFIEDGSVDVIFFCEIIEHLQVEHIDNVLQELKRKLKDGGRLVISTPNAELSKGYEFHVKEFTIEEMGRILEAHNLQIDKTWGWLTTKRLIESDEMSYYNKMICEELFRGSHPDLVLNILAHLYPEFSDSVCYEVRKIENEKENKKR